MTPMANSMRTTPAVTPAPTTKPFLNVVTGEGSYG
jgi:hypothetical protein